MCVREGGGRRVSVPLELGRGVRRDVATELRRVWSSEALPARCEAALRLPVCRGESGLVEFREI
jgi:hypothetical protein